MNHILEADGILLEFNTRSILSNIYLKCKTGEITGILGRNGEGKTCLMNIIYGNLNPLGKSIRFDSISVPQAFKRPDFLTYLPQFNFIPGHLTIKKIFSDFELDFKFFETLFPEYGSRYASRLDTLSGGQRRLIEVYSIICMDSKFSMLDEPFSHLMPIQIEKINELIEENRKTKGFLITDHLYRNVIKLCDQLYVLKDGTLHRTSNVSDIERLGYARLD